MELNFDYRPSNNHWAKVMAKEMIDNEGWWNYDAAYEAAWDIIEGELECKQIVLTTSLLWMV